MILVAYVGMVVTEKFIIPKLGKYYFDEKSLHKMVFLVKKKEKVLFFR